MEDHILTTCGQPVSWTACGEPSEAHASCTYGVTNIDEPGRELCVARVAFPIFPRARRSTMPCNVLCRNAVPSTDRTTRTCMYFGSVRGRASKEQDEWGRVSVVIPAADLRKSFASSATSSSSLIPAPCYSPHFFGICNHHDGHRPHSKRNIPLANIERGSQAGNAILGTDSKKA